MLSHGTWQLHSSVSAAHGPPSAATHVLATISDSLCSVGAEKLVGLRCESFTLVWGFEL